jgi:hypothetical protein
MESSQLNWPSQRNKRRWAVVWFLFLLFLLALTSCTVQPRYHQRGWNIQFNSNKKQSFNQKQTSYPKKSPAIERTFLDDSLEQMHISQRLINAGKNKKWAFRNDTIPPFITKQLRTMTIIGDSITMHGKLIAANKNGIFLYNPHDPLFWVSKKPYGKTQTAIRDKVLFVPYTDIQQIKKGGTLASKLERILNGLFWIWFSLSSVLGGIWANARFGNSSWIGADAWEALMLVVMLIAYLATLALTVVLSLILTPLLFLLQLPVAKLKGRYWKINKSSEKGNEFLEYIKEHHRRYRLYQSDINTVPPAKKSAKEEA